MSDLMSNLRKLLKDVLIKWTNNHEKDFQEMKKHQ